MGPGRWWRFGTQWCVGARAMNASPVPSRRLLGRYEIVAEIARGGMGTVFLARLEGVGGFQRLVAIKLMHAHLASEIQFTHMLLDEARLAAQLHHPNAVSVVDVAESDIGLYIVMDYVDGFALDRVLVALRDTPEKRIRIGLRIWLDAVRGLGAAHRLRDEDGEPLGIVHRDVSPQNILVGIDGAGRITDFGVARAAARITSSHPGMIKGKPCYMAPEQAKASDVDARADTFALGIVLWEILAGRMLFDIDGGAAATLLRVISDPIPLASTAAPEAAPLDAACAKSLERDLNARFQTARELYEAVEVAARAAGLLATEEEVADFMQEAFASEMVNRKAAIKEHLSAIRDASPSLMNQSDVFAVPSLNMKKRSEAHTSAERPTLKASESGPWHEASEPSREGLVSPEAATVSGQLSAALPPAPTMTPSSQMIPSSETPPQPRWKTLAVMLAVGGVLMACAAAWVLSNTSDAESEVLAQEEAEQERTEQAQDDAVALEHAEALAEAAEREAAAHAAAAASADEVRVVREASASAALEAAAAAAEAEAEEAARAERSARRRATMDSSAMESATDSTMMDTTNATMQTTMQPGFENNPYLR
ncbi:MAG: serine/threonine protein kinase [Polyangiales bacterium]|jgi:serine/threonine protein kinase